jgi:polysaccharide deacetylase family protein (PEP-CTERM system associated)
MKNDLRTISAGPEKIALCSEEKGPDPFYAGPESVPVVLSFDVEEHDRIEAAVGLEIESNLKVDYRQRMRQMTGWILEELAVRNIPATFFILGQVAEKNAGMVRDIHEAGHEVASHGWDHRRIHVMNPESFREDVRKSKDTLEQVTGAAVVGYRAPTFSIVKKTAWALDVLAELGLLYDSSIYPVRHDRYGVPRAPRGPFMARGCHNEILEIPPATVRIGGVNVPMGGGGYFRLLPFPLMKMALSLSRRDPRSGATVLYFHPWEFDPDQPRLPLTRLSRFRTYVGIRHSQRRLTRLLAGYPFMRAVDLARRLQERRETLPRFCPAT